MHQLLGEVKKFQGFSDLRQKPPNPNGYDFEGENAQNACTTTLLHDPSSQPTS
jgi:hypothetical protein